MSSCLCDGFCFLIEDEFENRMGEPRALERIGLTGMPEIFGGSGSVR